MRELHIRTQELFIEFASSQGITEGEGNNRKLSIDSNLAFDGFMEWLEENYPGEKVKITQHIEAETDSEGDSEDELVADGDINQETTADSEIEMMGKLKDMSLDDAFDALWAQNS